MFVVDLIISVLLGYSLYKGMQKGLVVSLVSFVGLVVGIYLSLRFSFYMRDILREITQWSANTIVIAAFFFTFIAVLFALYFLGRMLTRLMRNLSLGFLNKMLGAVFEGVKMVLIISVVLNLFQKINHNNLIASQERLEESIFYQPVLEVSHQVFPLMEKWYKLALSHTMEGVKNMREKEEGYE